jgi:hypothetical protein
MIQVLQARKITLGDLEEKYGLSQASNLSFFGEWSTPNSDLTDEEKLVLDRVAANFRDLLKRPPLLENSVKMVILSPLLDLAGFYRKPFRIESETSIELEAEDGNEIIRGRIDVLVVRQRLWLLVIEAKRSDFATNTAIAQALAGMMGNPDASLPTFGMVTNGVEFIFLKLVKQPIGQYANSRLFTLVNPGNELHDVLSVLKQIGTAIV